MGRREERIRAQQDERLTEEQPRSQSWPSLAGESSRVDREGQRRGWARGWGRGWGRGWRRGCDWAVAGLLLSWVWAEASGLGSV